MHNSPLYKLKSVCQRRSCTSGRQLGQETGKKEEVKHAVGQNTDFTLDYSLILEV